MRIKTKEDRRDRIKHRIRKRVAGKQERPRLTVFRSVTHMYVQVVDDATGRTIASASTVEPSVKGALVSGVDPGSPAEKAGMKQGDVITSYNGRQVEDNNQLRNAVSLTTPGCPIT